MRCVATRDSRVIPQDVGQGRGLPPPSQERLNKQAGWWVAFLQKLSQTRTKENANMTYRQRQEEASALWGWHQPRLAICPTCQGFALTRVLDQKSTNAGFAVESVITMEGRTPDTEVLIRTPG